MSEVKEQSEVQQHLDHLFREVSLLREEVRTSVSSRRGLPGIAGPVGPAGNDAVVKIQQADGKIQVLDPNGKVQAEIVAVPGPEGKSIVGPKGDTGATGASGRDGKNAPTLSEAGEGRYRTGT